MPPDDPLAPWLALDEATRAAVTTALQQLADAEGEAVKWSGVESLRQRPRVEVRACRREGDALVITFGYRFSIARTAQAGSDWLEIHSHSGEATWRDGAVTRCSLDRDERSFPFPD